MKKLRFVFAAALSVFIATGCGAKQETPKASQAEPSIGTTIEGSQEASKPEESVPEKSAPKTEVNLAMLKGPTAIGAAKLIDDNENGTTANDYQVTLASAPDEVVGKVVSGEIDIAAVPTNLAATLYNKTEGGVKMVALNTLGVLYLLENGDTIQSPEDLHGQTIYATGQGATPEYVLNYILNGYGLLDSANGEPARVEWMAEHAELAAALAAGDVKLGLLPEPNVTAVLMKNSDVRVAMDMTKEWDKLNEESGATSQLTMGCVIVRNDFLEENQEAFDIFMEEYKASIDYATSNVSDTAALVEKEGIMASAAAAEKAIPSCNIVFIDGQEMKDAAEGFFQVLFEANPKSVGGKLPDESFYYTK